MYEYAANLVRVIDGDTVCVDIDLGFTIKISIEFRLLGINTPEMRGASKLAGRAAKDHLTQLLAQGSLTVQSEKPLKTDKYGRYLASITVTRKDGTKFNANATMIADGHAVSYNP
jgi:micrococcal nuclease